MKTSRIVATLLVISSIGYFYVAQESPVYCFAQNRAIPDGEFIKSALDAREAEIAYYGGIDSYEKYLNSINHHPNEAGRDFDIGSPNSINVFRGLSAVIRHCKLDYPFCVSLNFPKLEGPPTYGSSRGRIYLFNACGKLIRSY